MTISVNTRISRDRKSVDVILSINNQIYCLGYFDNDELSDLADELNDVVNELLWRKEAINDTAY